jgi:methylated-DNA-[protein]-cysteine S-methyltransferase
MKGQDHPIALVDFSIFETACGWMGLVGQGETVQHLKLGYDNAADLRDDLAEIELYGEFRRESDWSPELREKLQAFAAGQRVSFAGVRCDLPQQTEFQRKVVQHVRKIHYGHVASYGEVAQAVGCPGAARAVGTVMSSNCVPIIIPCHRVVAAGGKLGGYSAPRGIELKQWLLELEKAKLPRRAK